jgi:pimeloyl-ACP methyl ester carboxylesterase
MTFLIIILVGLSSVVLLRYLLHRYVNQLKRNPDPIPLAALHEDPAGTTTMLNRPDGGVIRTITAGEGPTVMLAHGYGISLKEWNIVMNRLVEQGFRVIAFDQMGHGQSTIGSNGLDAVQMASNYKQVLEAFEVTDGVLVGHSMGGFLSLATLLNFPEVAERLKGLVLFASTAGDVSKGAPQNKVQLPLLKSGILTALVKNDLFGFPFGSSIMGDTPSPAVIRTFVADFLDQDHTQLLPILKELVETSYYDRLGEITVSTVVICGRKDQTTPPWHSETLGRDIPNARNVWVEKRGHMLNWEAPESLIQVVNELHGKTGA